MNRIKLLLGGSPCTHWSIAQTKNRETEPSGVGWELFLNYRIARDRFRPDFFLYENNKSISPAIRAQITKELGVEPVLINSALVSAQSRQRLYWAGRRGPDGTYSQVSVEQPADRGIILLDILESGVSIGASGEKAYALKAQYFKSATANFLNGGGHFPQTGVAEPVRIGTIESGTKTQHDSKPFRVYSPDGKAVTLQGEAGGYGAKTGLYATPIRVGDMPNASGEINSRQSGRIYSVDGKGVPLQVRPNGGGADGAATGLYAVPAERDGKIYPVYEVRDGQITIKGKRYPIKLADGWYIIRKLTVRECMRLQTVPEDFIFPVSYTQAYKMLGNGWTVDVIAHILSHFDGIMRRPLDVLSMYDGMSCGHLALDKLGATVARYHATEIDKYAVKTAQANYPDTVQLGDAFQVRDPCWDAGELFPTARQTRRAPIPGQLSLWR